MLEKLLASKDSENFLFQLHSSKETKGFTITANQDYMELMESLEVQGRVLVVRQAAQLLCIHDYGNRV